MTDNKTCYLVINPNRYPQYVKILKKIVKKYSQFHVLESVDSTHFTECISQYYNSKAPYILIWGGDGTAHAAINKLTELKLTHKEDDVKRSIGFLRGGSGNGIQDSYEVPFGIFKQLKTYINSMENNYSIDVDLLRAEYDGKIEYTQLAGVGFDAHILNIRDQDKYKTGPLKGRIKPGLWNYLTAVGKALLSRIDKNGDFYTLKMDSGRYVFQGTRVNAQIQFTHLEKECNPLMIEVGNRPYFAALFKICPHVVCNSGDMNLYVYHKMTRATMLRNLRYFWTGQHNRINDRFARKKKPIIENFEVQRSQISAKKPFYFHMDGDLRKVETEENGDYNLKFTILPTYITFLVPEAFFNKFHPPGIH